LTPSASGFCGYGLDLISLGVNALSKYDYGTVTGPVNWHHLDPGYGSCASGTRQSPILLTSHTTTLPPGSVTLDIPPSAVSLQNLGIGVEVFLNGTLEAGGTWDDAGTTWDLAQFHFHTPSEHRVDLRHFESEMHMVFSRGDQLAVVGFLIQVARESTQLLETIFEHLDEIRLPCTSTIVPWVDFDAFQAEANAQSY